MTVTDALLLAGAIVVGFLVGQILRTWDQW